VLSLIPLFPFVGFLVNSTCGRRLSKGVSGGLASLAMLASFVVSVIAVWQLAGLAPDRRVIDQTPYTWIASGDFVLDLTFRLDPLSAVMILVVTGIGFLIHVYSTAYMHDEVPPEYARYFSYLNLFGAFMLVLVLAASFVVMFVGWEGVGLCSYLLIGFWFKRKSASDAGKKAFIVNRIGDYAFILGMLLLFTHFGTLDFGRLATLIAPLAPEAGFGTLSMAALLLFIGATGKSAQIPLHVWLPDAMEGPTPVSALIHAATMVTAGVYMIGRNAVLYSHAPEVLIVVAVIGAVTALFAATIGLVQFDIKRVLAYSTVSQLGYMFLAMGVGAFGAGIFHLYTHAFFKALLFLGSGAVIHALAGEQDIRRMGGLKNDLPITYWTFLIGALAIAGVPGLAGFFSKDEILYETFAHGQTVLWVIGIITSTLTAFYMFRLVFLTFWGQRRMEEHAHPNPHAHADPHAQPHSHLHDAPPAMAIALVVLALGSVLAGYIGVPHALGGENRLAAWLEPAFKPPPAAEANVAAGVQPSPRPQGAQSRVEGQASGAGGFETAGQQPGEPSAETHGGAALELTLMGVSTAVALIGIGLAAFLYLKRRELPAQLAERFPRLHLLLLNRYYVDELYDRVIVRPIRIASQDALWRGFDVAVIDGAVNGMGAIVAGGAWTLRRLQTGSVRAYAGSLFLGVILILGYYLWR
jgi:NADH-quinone oxidoreductase subunit L